jgi:hypothetical protein
MTQFFLCCGQEGLLLSSLLLNFLLFVDIAHSSHLVGATISSYDNPFTPISRRSSCSHCSRVVRIVRGGNTVGHNNHAVASEVPPILNNLFNHESAFLYHHRRQLLPSSSISMRDSINNRPIPATLIRLIPPAIDGLSSVQVDVKQITVTKLQLSQQLSCPLRDLRIIMDPTVSSYIPASASTNIVESSSTNATASGAGYGSTTALLPRKSGIIFHISGHARAIIRNDFTVLVFGSHRDSCASGVGYTSSSGDDEAKRGSTVNSLVQLIIDHLTNTYSEESTKDLLLFELVVLEALLYHVSMEESNQASAIIQSANSVLEGILVSDSDSTDLKKKEVKRDSFMVMQARLGNLLPLKNKLDSLEAHCAEIAAAINELLHNEKEMKAMYLSRQKEQTSLLESSTNKSKVANSTTITQVGCDVDNGVMELELLLEDFLLRMEEMLYSLRQVQSSIKNTEEVVDIELDLMRNAIMRHELLLESYSFAASFAAAITGLFGMNLLNHMEYHKNMFYVVTVVLLFASIAIARGIQHQLRTVYVL